MPARVHSLYRHPIKGFTPERLDAVTLSRGDYFPCDRIYVVEDGPSGFDPDHPVFISKQKFAVLAKMPKVACARTRYDEASGRIFVSATGMTDLSAVLTDADGREALAVWLAQFLGDDARGPLRVLPAPAMHRFTDAPDGFVSIVNLASVADLERRLGAAIDPLRLRANLYVAGWPAWSENAAVGRVLSIGSARLQITGPIVRCAATHVDPATGLRDLDLVAGLFEAYGDRDCGVYAKVIDGGTVAQGAAADWLD
jgi:uncharacterized protein YcbX